MIERLKPEIFLTFTDGEPIDVEAIGITKKLKSLGCNRSIAVSNLNEVPKKILHLLVK